MAVQATPPPTSSARTRLGQIAIEQQGRRQRWLADQIDVSEATLSRYVNGLHVPDDKRAVLAEVLGRSESDLFDGNGAHLPPLPAGSAA